MKEAYNIECDLELDMDKAYGYSNAMGMKLAKK